MLVDLDDTLLDRRTAFRLFARELLDDIGAPAEDLEWLVTADDDGRTSRYEVADALRIRYGLTATVVDIVEALQEGVVGNVRLDPMVACALQIAANAGWVPVIVTNGSTYAQEAKIRRTGLDRYVADWVVSEEAGVRKPDVRIFELAADRARMDLRGGWVIGDSPQSDVAGAVNLGLPSVWLHRGRRWPETRFTPTVGADNLIAAIAAVLDRGSSRGHRQAPTGGYRKIA
jgi:putative hydrolase of the HAD superfamily